MTVQGNLKLAGKKNTIAYWLSAGAFLFIIGFAVSLIRGVNTADEAWFLEVLYRVTSGEVLYRDIFFGITPLSIYLTLLPIRLFGAEILVVKAVMAICYSLTILLAVKIAGWLSPATSKVYVLTIALAVYFSPIPTSLYKAIAEVFFLSCLSVALLWLHNQGDLDPKGNTITLALAGVFAGLCFLSDQIFGAYALAALILVMMTGSIRSSSRPGGNLHKNVPIPVMGFGITSLLFLLPVWFSGGWVQFMDYGFLNKGTYVRAAGISYLYEIGLILPFFQHISLDNFRLLFDYSLYLLPPFILALIVLTWWRTKGEKRQIPKCIFFFTGAAWLTAFPRVDWPHFIYAVPVLLIGLFYSLQELKPNIPRPWMRYITTTILMWLLLGIGAEAATTIGNMQERGVTISQLPYFRGALFPPANYRAIRNYSGELVEASSNRQLLIVIPEAGFYYLVTGLRNPSPFDYPLVTAFGRTGEAGLVKKISLGEISRVCLRPLAGTWADSLRPKLLETYIQENMVPRQNIGLCTVYENP